MAGRTKKAEKTETPATGKVVNLANRRARSPRKAPAPPLEDNDRADELGAKLARRLGKPTPQHHRLGNGCGLMLAGAIETAERLSHEAGAEGFGVDKIADIAATIFEARYRRSKAADRLAHDLEEPEEAARDRSRGHPPYLRGAVIKALRARYPEVDLRADMRLLKRGIALAEQQSLAENGTFLPDEIGRIALTWYAGYCEKLDGSESAEA